MELIWTQKKREHLKGDLLVCFVRQHKKKGLPICPITEVRSILEMSCKSGDFSGKEGESFLFYPQLDKDFPREVQGVVLLGLGHEKLTRETFRRCGGVLAQILKKRKTQHLLVEAFGEKGMALEELYAPFVEGVILGLYQFNKYQGKKKEEQRVMPKAMTLIVSRRSKKLEEMVAVAHIGAETACSARDMANEPGNYWTAEHFAKRSRRLAKKYGLKSRVIGVKEMKRLNMGGILGVNQGSEGPAKMVLLEYHRDKNLQTLLLVGKGLTFDSGGISLKPSEGMQDMKYDMCGGAAVLSVMEAVGRIKPQKVNVVAVIPTTDNMPGKGSLKPGDIIRQYNGTSVEIISTDAEGRLILADALSYGIEVFQPDAVIDLATLTGAVIIGLGHHKTGLMGNHDLLAQHLLGAGERSGEPLWRLPVGGEYKKQLESQVADLKNIGGRPGGTITAATYLQEFVGKTPWAHLDIAGTAWDCTEKSYIPKGPSGVGVRTLLQLIADWRPIES